MRYRVSVEGRSFEIDIDHNHLVWVDGQPLYVDLEQVGGLPVYSLVAEDQGYVVFVEKGEEQYLVEVQGQVLPVHVKTRRPHLAPRRVTCADTEEKCLAISAPLPGTLVSLPVAVGQAVSAGQTVAVVESMKMQMELRAPQPGQVTRAEGPAGRNVDQGEELVVLQTES
jgi:biotin carboxyl carrier protein